MKVSPLLPFALFACTALAAEPCDLAMLVGTKQLSDFTKLSEMPAEQMREKGKFEQIELFCPAQSMVSDAFGYTAFISSREAIAYVHQYGGYFGVSDWYGPVPIQPALAERCISQQRTRCPSSVAITETE